MKDIVFIGPSLALEQARAICAADYRPPVRMGDVYRAANEHPRSITIIDGVFERIPAVWHKEILYALDRGITVYGGSSMGALRAAELDAFGMVGIGSIYLDFASGVLTDDDEVAVAHSTAESGYVATSTALVNLRSGVAGMVISGLLEAEEARRLIGISKRRFYPDRSWEALLNDASDIGISAERVAAMNEWIATRRPDQKRDDAIEVLMTLERERVSQERRPRVPFGFEHTVYWETVETYCSAHGQTEASSQFERVRNHVRIFESDRDALIDRGLLLMLARQEARRLKLPAVDDRAALKAFRTRRGLESVAALASWLAHNAMTHAECLELARLEWRLGELRNRYIEAIDRNLPTVLKLDGRYAEVTARVADKWRVVGAMESDQVSEQDGAVLGDVLDWYQQKHGRIAGTLEQHAHERGIGSSHQLRQELFAEYLSDAQLV